VNLKKISIELSIDDLKKIVRIVLEENPEAALKFVTDNLLKKVEAALQPH
jgi:hypothetical protein